MARLGDRMWDVAHHGRMRKGQLAHVSEKRCYLFCDPRLAASPRQACLSGKLPGQ